MTTGLWLVMGAAVVTRIGAGPMLRPVLRYESGGVDPVIGNPDENAFLPGYGFEVRVMFVFVCVVAAAASPARRIGLSLPRWFATPSIGGVSLSRHRPANAPPHPPPNVQSQGGQVVKVVKVVYHMFECSPPNSRAGPSTRT